MSKKIDDALRAKYLEVITKCLKDAGEEVLRTETGTIVIPCVDDDGNDAYVEFNVKIPKGARDGSPLDPWTDQECYLAKCKEKEEKAKANAEAKAAKIKRDKEMREAKAAAKRRAKEST